MEGLIDDRDDDGVVGVLWERGVGYRLPEYER